MNNDPTAQHRVVIHIADADRITAVLQNIANLRRELGEQATIEAVVHGPAILSLTTTSPQAGRISEILATGTGIDACHNSMTSHQLSAAQLIPGVQIVTSGVAHLARRQWEGYAYLRP